MGRAEAEKVKEDELDPYHSHTTTLAPPTWATHHAPSLPPHPHFPTVPPIPLYSHTGPQNTQRLAPHDVGLMAKGVALPEMDQKPRKAVVDGIVNVYMLHRVLYPQVHDNGIKKKKKKN
jgi:hypothetical protein